MEENGDCKSFGHLAYPVLGVRVREHSEDEIGKVDYGTSFILMATGSQ